MWQIQTFDGTFPIFEMPPLLCIKHEFLTAGLALVPSYSTVTEPVGVIVVFVRIMVWAVSTLVIFSAVSLQMSGEITLIEKSFTTFWIDSKETGLGTV